MVITAAASSFLLHLSTLLELLLLQLMRVNAKIGVIRFELKVQGASLGCHGDA